MGDTLLKILEETTALTIDVDLFYLEMPLDTSGLWVSDSPTDSRFNSVDAYTFDIYYRGKDKQQTIDNIQYLKSTIEDLSGSGGTCQLEDGTTFKLEIMFTWDYLEKDAEGYYVFANQLRLLL